MGTRADFYIGRGEKAEWIGSIAWDGYPNGKVTKKVLTAKTKNGFYAAVCDLLEEEDHHSTIPEQGWPWPWDDSNTTDYSYALDQGTVRITQFGYGWVTYSEYLQHEKEYAAWEKEPDPENDDPPPELWTDENKTCVFPNMSSLRDVSSD